MMFTPSRPGSFGLGNWRKYWEPAVLGPMPRGSMAAIWAGVRPYQPGCTVWVLLNPRTEPPGHWAAVAHRYTSTPSRNEFEGTARSTGRSLSESRVSTLAKKKKRSRMMGPPRDAPKMFLSSFGRLVHRPRLSWASFRKYSLLEVAVRRGTQ